MSSATAHPPGVFCWPELSTTDAAAAARFYGAVFDWQSKTLEVRRQRYTVFQAGEQDVSGSCVTSRVHGEGPRWNSSVCVENADETAARAKELGATLVRPPFDLLQVSRVAVLRDPQGAIFYLWQPRHGWPQPRAPISAPRTNQPGSLCWTELITSDQSKSESFYTNLFGWSAHRFGDYVEFLRGREPVAGMLSTPPGRGAEGSHWLPYFTVADVDDAVQVARRHFGTILGRPMDIPLIGRSAVLRDPQGATFGIFGTDEAA
jgi:predicted enzyme related to lactoylglutathione lyase